MNHPNPVDQQYISHMDGLFLGPSDNISIRIVIADIQISISSVNHKKKKAPGSRENMREDHIPEI